MIRIFLLLFFNFICITIYSQDKQSAEQIEKNDCRAAITKKLNSPIRKEFTAYTMGNELHMNIKYNMPKISSKIPKDQKEEIRNEAREQAIQTLKNISGYIEDPQNICKFEAYVFNVTIFTNEEKQVQHNYKMFRWGFNDLSGNFTKENLAHKLICISK